MNWLSHTLSTVLGLVVATAAALAIVGPGDHSGRPATLRTSHTAATSAVASSATVQPEVVIYLISSQTEAGLAKQMEEAAVVKRAAAPIAVPPRNPHFLEITSMEEQEAAFRFIADLLRDAVGVRVTALDLRGEAH
jgi:hypothetical protein